MWKWRELLPLPDGVEPVSLGETETPILPLTSTGGPNLLVKDEGRLPTGSFKARGLAMAVTMAKQFGIDADRHADQRQCRRGAGRLWRARRGSRRSSSARPKRPRSTSARPRPMAREVYVADGQIDECGALVGKGAAEGLWFDCSTLKEPYRLEGKKVMGFELAEQLGWKLPDAIFYPTGGGTGLIGMWKAFDELEAVGLIGPERPRMYRGPGRGLRADRPRVRGGRGVRRALGRCGDGRDRNPRAQGGRRFPDPARGARQRRRGARGRARRRSSQAVEDAARDDGFLLCPEGGAVLAAWRLALERGLVGQGRARAAVQLRQRQQISAARPVEAAGAGAGGRSGAISERT